MEQVRDPQLEQLAEFLDRILPKKKRPIYGSLPYRNLNYPSREPSDAFSIKPAYKGGNKAVSPEDLKSTEEAPHHRRDSRHWPSLSTGTLY